MQEKGQMVTNVNIKVAKSKSRMQEIRAGMRV